MIALDYNPEAAIKELLTRQAARKHLLAFTRYTKKDYFVNWHHRTLAGVLSDVVMGLTPDPSLNTPEALQEPAPIDNPHRVLLPNAPKRLIITMPPRNGKTELASRRLPAFALGCNPNLEIIAVSYSADLATLINRDVQQIMTTPEYVRLFPRSKLNITNVRTTAQNQYLRNSDIFEVIGSKGRYRSAGVGGGIGGMGAKLAILDDPIKNREEADSEVYREKLWRFYTSTFRLRVEDNGAIIIILTRWHDDDLAGRLLDLEQSNPKADKWALITLPAILDMIPDQETQPKEYESYTRFEQRTELDTPLWPAKFPIDILEGIKALNPDDFESLQQQRPIKPGGALFPMHLWKYIDDFILFDDMVLCRAWDKGGTEGSGAYTAGVLICYDPVARYGVNYIVLDVRRQQYAADSREKLIRDTALQDRGRYGDVHYEIEQEPGSGGKDSVNITIHKTLAGFDVDKSVASARGDKPTLWKPFSAQQRASNVALFIAEWNDAYIKELSRLPSGKFKDQADASGMAFNRVTLGWQEEFLAIVYNPVEISPF